ncbi:metallophosphoesterase [Chryseobacterium capnotolerans]|uniref:metallophosphoesterase n=1 Tax=Chryseobacterium TaxID=59732 RepID=UPI00083AEA6B|nr:MULTISPECIES: metallophosphoesterase [Chryseobacterium]UHO37756.1 metallophosphoesterase [Chryseobacterium capnotolerans]
MNRKTFLKKILQVSVLGTVPGLYSWQVEPFWVEFVQRKLLVKNLPKALDGKILMQISDLHVGARFDWNFLIDSFQKAKEYQPDFVVYTGDFVNRGTPQEQADLRKVMENCVLGTSATFGILGNHDYGENWNDSECSEEVCDTLSNSGITMLRNAQAESRGLNFIGFEDLWSPHFQPLEAMTNYDPSKANIVLCHNPDACDLDIWNGYQGWILSGHTHGGQCRIPGIITPILPVKNKKYVSGEIDLKDGRMLYINRALGHSFQVRFMVRPEITVFTLTQA